MALPSAVTLGSLALVVAAGVGLAAVASSNASEDPAVKNPAAGSSGKPLKPATSTTSNTSDSPAKAQPGRSGATTRRGRHRSHPTATPKVFVEVYNNSGITGLAAAKAQVLEQAGWNVAATDNWYGTIPVNTVYYPAKLHAQAVQLAKVLHIGRQRPAVSPMQFDRLTVIYTTP